MGAVLGFPIGVVGRVWKAFVNFLIFVRREKRRETELLNDFRPAFERWENRNSKMLSRGSTRS
jgi:hypothetical protein